MQSSLEKKVNPCFLGFCGKICPPGGNAGGPEHSAHLRPGYQAAHLGPDGSWKAAL